MCNDIIDTLKKDWLELQISRRKAQLKKQTAATLNENYVEFIVRAKILDDKFEGWIRFNKENCIHIFRYVNGLRHIIINYSQLKNLKKKGENGITFSMSKRNIRIDYEICFRDNLARKMALGIIQQIKGSENCTPNSSLVYLSAPCLV